MKILIALIATTMIVACATTGQGPISPPIIDQESKELAAKITGRRVGAELQKKYPEIATELYPVALKIATSGTADIDDIVIESLMEILASEIDDKILAADIEDLMTMLKGKVDVAIKIEPDQLRLVIAAAKGLASGIELQKEIGNE